MKCKSRTHILSHKNSSAFDFLHKFYPGSQRKFKQET